MKRFNIMLMAAALTVAAAHAAQKEVTVTLPLDTITVSTNIPVTVDGQPLEYLTVTNSASFSNTVTLLSYNAGVAQATLYSGTLAAGGSATVYPVRAFDDGASTNRPYWVSTVRATVTSASGATNTTAGPVGAFFQTR